MKLSLNMNITVEKGKPTDVLSRPVNTIQRKAALIELRIL